MGSLEVNAWKKCINSQKLVLKRSLHIKNAQKWALQVHMHILQQTHEHFLQKRTLEVHMHILKHAVRFLNQKRTLEVLLHILKTCS